MAVRREEGAIVVEHSAELAVRIFGLQAFYRRPYFREVWRNHRMFAFNGLVEENGEPFPIKAHAEADPPCACSCRTGFPP